MAWYYGVSLFVEACSDTMTVKMIE